MEQEPVNFDPNIAPPKDRGGCLTALLLLMMISSVMTALLYFALPEMIIKMNRKAGHDIPEWAPMVLGLLSLVHGGMALLAYNWKKIGVIGIIVNAIAVLIVNITAGLGPFSFAGLIGVVVFIVLVNPVWKHFK